MSIATDIADALAAGLTAYTFSSPYADITATRMYVPDYEGTAIQSLKVAVVPGPLETERSSRGQDLFTHQVLVVVVKATNGTNSEVDALMRLCEQMIDAIRSETLVTTGMPSNARYFGSSMATQFDRDALTDKRVFMSHIEVTYRVPRDHITVTGVA